MKRYLLVMLCLLFLPMTANAGTAALEFNDESAEMRLDVPLSEDSYGKVMVGGRLLFNDDEETEMASVEFKVVGDPGSVPGLEVGAGFVGYVGESHDVYDFNNVGIALMADYAPPTLQGLGFSVRASYAPDIFSWQDSDGLFEFNTRVYYALTPKVKVYAGYQSIEGEIDGLSRGVDLDKETRVGLMLVF